MSQGNLQMSLKRKRGAGYAVLNAAQKGGSIARTEYVNHLKANTHPRNRVAQMNAFIPKGRSAIRQVLKNETYKDKFANRNKTHAHDMMRKFNRGKPLNGVKSFLQTIS